MANTNTLGFGLRSTMTVGNTPATQGQSEFKIQTAPGTSTFKGDPVNIQAAAGADGYLQDAAQGTMDDGITGGVGWANNTANIGLLTGVFNGAFYVDSTGKPTWANSVTAAVVTSTNYNTGSNEIDAFVITDPMQEYTVRADALLGATTAAAQALFNPAGTFYNVNSVDLLSPTNVDGMSRTTLDIGGSGANNAFTMVRSANIPNQNDLLSQGADVIVTIQPASALYN